MSEPEQTAIQAPHIVITRGDETPPLTIGPKRLHYQYTSALPQAHLTFVSIVQGIAFGVLIQGWPLPRQSDLAGLASFIFAEHLYLPWIISSLVVVVIWKQFVQASLFVRYPLFTFGIFLMLLIGVAETFSFREIEHTFAWMACLGVVGIVGGLIRLANIGIMSEREWEVPGMRKDGDLHNLVGAIAFGSLGILFTATGCALHYMPVLAQMWPWLSWVAIALVGCIVVGVVAYDASDSKRFLTVVLKGSDLEYAPPGSIRYRD